VIEAIADERRSPQYRGLRIEPQVGLVPVGQDPDSGLFEFAHLQTGEPPARDPVTGRLVPTENAGLVFVLLPRGSFLMGSVAPSPEKPLGSPHVVPHRFAVSSETPLHRIELDAFFISKYEMTQGQWLRLTGENPSYAPSGRGDLGPVTLLHPVQNVTWSQAARGLRRVGLVLPAEAQWEYATRAGTTSVWWTGDERESLHGAANLVDESVARAGLEWSTLDDRMACDDGYILPAPVGSFRANPFGLHDVAGNVWEWVRDVYSSYRHPVRSGDGERIVEESGYRILRGGSHFESWGAARSSGRFKIHLDGSAASWGIRPARAVSGSGTARGGGRS
jgi:formylglycine-generating enzyme required for sulfatase activity